MSSSVAVYQFNSPRPSYLEVHYETSQSSHYHPSLRFAVSRFVQQHGPPEEAGICLMLQDEALLLRKQALLQKSKSRLLHR